MCTSQGDTKATATYGFAVECVEYTIFVEKGVCSIYTNMQRTMQNILFNQITWRANAFYLYVRTHHADMISYIHHKEIATEIYGFAVVAR